MEPELNWDDQSPHKASPGDALVGGSGSLNNNANDDQSEQEQTRAEASDATAEHGDAIANGLKQKPHTDSETSWPPPGDAALTIDETRIHLLDEHDIYHKERYTQKLRSDHHKLDGRRVARAGGGVEIKISRASIDRYAHELNKDRTTPQAAETPLDPTDKLFGTLREIAGRKPYGIVIEAQRPETPAPRDATPLAAHQPAPLTSDTKNEASPQDAGGTPNDETGTPVTAPASEYVTFLKEMFVHFKTEAENERTKKEAAQKAREDDRDEFARQLDTVHKEHQSQQNDLIDELANVYNSYISAREANARLTAAYHEAKAKLPPGTELHATLEDTDNPNQQQLIPPVKPNNIRFHT